MLGGKRILLIISGGIAAYKALELIRLLRRAGAGVRCILTPGGAEFVTPLSVSALTEDKVYTELFSLTDEAEMGHIRLSREADLVVVAPASASLLARLAAGIADDLATTALLATDKPVLAAPAMNVRMWEHPATRANMATLAARGVALVGPEEGPMACGEYGFGRLAEPATILAAIAARLGAGPAVIDPAAIDPAGFASGGPLVGRRALVTSGPTQEPVDPVRYLGNRSSGRQGHAIAAALARRGAETVLVSGPTGLPDPDGVRVVRVVTAREMLAACEAALPVDLAVCAAAVADWRVADEASAKIKKDGGPAPVLRLVENPDILANLSRPGERRPALVVGFAAETEDSPDRMAAVAEAKRAQKGCDWIVANDVSAGTGTFGGPDNAVTLIRRGLPPERWPRLTKEAVGDRLAEALADALASSSTSVPAPAPTPAMPAPAVPAAAG